MDAAPNLQPLQGKLTDCGDDRERVEERAGKRPLGGLLELLAVVSLAYGVHADLLELLHLRR